MQNGIPCLRDLALGIVGVGVPQPIERQYLLVHVRDAVVEYHSVRHNRARHAACLGDFGHAEKVGNLVGGYGGLTLQLVQHADGAVYTVFQGACRGVDGALRDRYEAGEFGYICD